MSTLLASAAISLSLTIAPIRILEVLPNNKVHIVCNTGEQLETSFELNDVNYRLENCDLSPGKHIDTICDMVTVK